MSDDDLIWIKNLSSKYKWPEPSSDLKQKIMANNTGFKSVSVEETWLEFLLRVLQTKSATAMACMLVFGNSVGMLMIPQEPTGVYANHVYMDADLMLAKSILGPIESNVNEQ